MTLTFTGVFKGDSIQWLSVDYFYVTASEGSKLNPGNPAGGGGGGGGGGGSDGSNGSSSKTNVGAIAGGVVGGVVLLAAIGLVLFFFLKKRKSRNNYAGRYDGFQPQNMYNNPGPMINSGFGPAGPQVSQQYTPLQQTTPSVYSVPMSVVPGTVAASTVTPMASNSDPYRSSTYAASSSEGSRTALTHSSMVVANPSSNHNSNQNWMDMKDAQRAAIDTRPVERQHQDSGIRYPQPGVVDIPPTYTAA
ncbi:hypothetical protein L218DRAFT_109232 [Marasmius fiardii PR-910]|nr:hypothetical protein L218DRAFT_109232 [Marasmius fiardii PR-910]